ncbi:MAG: alginate lyase family protein, partial [Pseudomonadota bacterium]|nr:alginate lyase family protein [Pseudomonadota bacterium]
PPIKVHNQETLNKIFGNKRASALWTQIETRSYPTSTYLSDPTSFLKAFEDEVRRVQNLSSNVMKLKVDLLGSGEVALNKPINWFRDFKNNVWWPELFFRDIDVVDSTRKSDIKVAWELSRLQWLTPVAQNFMITADENLAEFAKDTIIHWIESNPYGRGPNWAVTMEAAMRVFTWTWLYHVFKSSTAWSEDSFRIKFICALYEHGLFCHRYLEQFAVSGNHLTADAAALVFLGEFFPENKETKKWQKIGWAILEEEIEKQVLSDGTGFEGSTAYHRFAAELFFWPALYREKNKKFVSARYKDRLVSMVEFTLCYLKPAGDAPLWGDNDDGRVFKFGTQKTIMHDYLPLLIRLGLGMSPLSVSSMQGASEILWGLGVKEYEIAKLSKLRPPASREFKESGIYIMANANDHIFIDCGPVGFRGRGGHGHNDCLSFEAVLEDVPLISDSGSYTYTESLVTRNMFRGTSSHNTPSIDFQEQNRFIDNEELFSLYFDAYPEVKTWVTDSTKDIFVGSHSGYARVGIGVGSQRTIILDKVLHGLVICDQFFGEGVHHVSIPYHFESGVEVEQISNSQWRILARNKQFVLQCFDEKHWKSKSKIGWISKSYGEKSERPVVEFTRLDTLEPLMVGIRGDIQDFSQIQDWMKGLLKVDNLG